MFYLLHIMDPQFWNALMESASRWGLGIVLSIVMAGIFFFVIRRTMSSFDKERALYQKEMESNREQNQQQSKQERDMFLVILAGKDETLNNHLIHLTDAQGKSNETLAGLKEIVVHVGADIIEALHTQTDVLKKSPFVVITPTKVDEKKE